MSIRPPTVENRFYPGDKQSLERMIDDFFTRAGGLPKTMDKPPVKGVVVPHAGYVFSGSTAARSYRALAEGFHNIDSLIIIGPSHTGLGQPVSVSKMDFETPFGIVRNDQNLADLILARSNIIALSEDAHILEHSIEVQLPFLQYISEKSGKEFSIVPMTVLSHNIHHAKEVGSAIHEAIRDSGKKVAIVASSDFTHGGAAYGFNPCPRKELVDWIYDHDRLALDRIKELDMEGFMEVKKKHHLTICGGGPIGVLIEFAKLEGAVEGKVLQYTTSYDNSHSLRAVVGYGSVVIP